MSYKEQILALREEGKTYSEIVNIVGCAKSTVSFHCKSYSLPERVDKSNNKCLNCDTKLPVTNKKYCNNKCQHEFQNKEYIIRWKNGEEKGWVGNVRQLSNTIRNYLLVKYNNSCTVCGWNELHPIDKKPLVEINHIDGNAENCMKENLEVLCPNCHSMTSNFRARNRNSTRKR